MQSFALFLILMSMYEMFVPTNGLSCYECSWDNAKCNTDELATSGKIVECKPSKFRLVKPHNLHLTKDFHCYKANVITDGKITVERGCKESNKTDDCITVSDKHKNAGTVVESCTVCKDEDVCNGGSERRKMRFPRQDTEVKSESTTVSDTSAASVVGMTVQGALMMAIVVGQLFVYAKRY